MKDRIQVTQANTLWLGLRHVELNRQSIQTDGTQPVTDIRGITTPWLAWSHELNAHDQVYASYSQGVEAEATPNSNSFTNAAQPLPVRRSSQREVGIKHKKENTNWQITWFDIKRPATTDGLNCTNATGSCTRQMDGQAHHQGLELNAQTRASRWDFAASATWLDAKRENATIDPSVNGQRPINVPTHILRGMAQYRFASVVGLRSGLRISHEAQRNVTENGDIMLPAWTTLDASTHYDTKANQVATTWTLAINNLTDERYWRESPKQYGQYFLYPGAPRTVRATVQFHL